MGEVKRCGCTMIPEALSGHNTKVNMTHWLPGESQPKKNRFSFVPLSEPSSRVPAQASSG
jgi:hypothetical protein